MQLEIYRSMTGEQRLRIALEMSWLGSFKKVGIRNLHPDCSEARVIEELLRYTLTPEPMPDWLK